MSFESFIFQKIIIPFNSLEVFHSFVYLKLYTSHLTLVPNAGTMVNVNVGQESRKQGFVEV